MASKSVLWDVTDRTRWCIRRRILPCHFSVSSTVSVNDNQAGAHDSWLAAGK